VRRPIGVEDGRSIRIHEGSIAEDL